MCNVTLRVEARTAYLTLERPDRHNALDVATLAAIPEACTEVSAANVDVLVLAGEGRDFSVGFDLGQVNADSAPDGARLGAAAVDAIFDVDAVTVARLQGWVVGGGVALAAACDLRVGDPTFRMRIPEVPLGIPLGWGAVPLLVAELGPAFTKELVMAARDVGADEAVARGFLNRQAPQDGLDREVADLVDRLLEMPSGPLRTTKRQVDTAAAVARTGAEDASLLLEAVADPGFRERFRRYLQGIGDR